MNERFAASHTPTNAAGGIETLRVPVGNLEQRLRLYSGLVLFAFALTHFLNHALGLVSLEAMHELHGVGDRKLDAYGMPFLQVILQHQKNQN